MLIGRVLVRLAQLRGGGGTALPGLVVERLRPHFMRDALAGLPHGVVVISGTNGKTTTTKIAVELLRHQGLRVFTNPSGSNFTRGVTSALLKSVRRSGRLEADIAVLEIDEGHLRAFTSEVAPRRIVLLNVFRDQLDRFGEIDTTARMLRAAARTATDEVILNRDDPRVAAIAASLDPERVRYFGLTPGLRAEFPGEDELHVRSRDVAARAGAPEADVLLSGIEPGSASYLIESRPVTAAIRLRGRYNALNAAAALALVRAVGVGPADDPALLATLASIEPAFGRGEIMTAGGQQVELVLVKNPAGFRLALKSYPSAGTRTMIAINDADADGRDVSWLWDVDFSGLRDVSVVSGTRALDMALRLSYDGVRPGHVERRLDVALQHLLAADPGTDKRIFCTYTAMLALRRQLARTNVLGGIT